MSFLNLETKLRPIVHYVLTRQAQFSTVFTLVFWGLTAWWLGALVWQPWQSSSVVTVWSPSLTTPINTAIPNRINLSELQAAKLFGEEKATPVPVKKAPVTVDAPPTRLNLQLVGVVANSDARQGLAVIANKGQQATYGVDETIEGTSVKLSAVLADRVILDNQGQSETLMLDGVDYLKTTTQTTGSNAAAQPAKSELKPLMEAEEQLALIRQEITQDPSQIFKYIMLSQVKQDDAIVGYRVHPGQNPELFTAVGLQAGDIAVQLNGLDLSDPEVMNKVFASVSQLSEIQLTVERDGQAHDIYIPF